MSFKRHNTNKNQNAKNSSLPPLVCGKVPLKLSIPHFLKFTHSSVLQSDYDPLPLNHTLPSRIPHIKTHNKKMFKYFFLVKYR